MSWYIDSSAIIKLIKNEKGSKALVAQLPQELITSQLSHIEVVRTINLHVPDVLEQAYDVLSDIPMLHIDSAVVNVAQSLPGFIKLRALDSIHIASALTIQSQIRGVITYDKEMATAAVALGFTVLSPGIN